MESTAVGSLKKNTREEQRPFEEMMRKELMAALKNIAGWTKGVWLQARTNGSANDKELLKGQTSECTNEDSVEHKEQNIK